MRAQPQPPILPARPFAGEPEVARLTKALSKAKTIEHANRLWCQRRELLLALHRAGAVTGADRRLEGGA